ncbi:MAG: prepilin-type N-terminal cleavage/methylation domain-containing protein [Verrucomicrobiae bacterium]|nr:prepilin-type N-terminal cleavage/methylation domain-containing protein [Verrucomicrobiae bacterium]
MRSPKTPPSKGFSLTELLVTMGVISILALLLIGAVQRVRKRAELTACLNNLRQLNICLTTFVTTANEYPLWLGAPGDDFSGMQKNTWIDSLYAAGGLPFVIEGIGSTRKDPKLVRCPGRAGELPKFENLLGYGYNGIGMELKDGAQLYLGIGGERRHDRIVAVRAESVLSPSAMIAMGDGIMGHKDRYGDGRHGVGIRLNIDNPSENERAVKLGLGTISESTKRVRKRHDGRMALAFCDGHVEIEPLAGLFSASPGSSRWFRDGRDRSDMMK